MAVTEQVMATGDWSITLTGDLPRSVTDPVSTLWSHLIITPARLPPAALESAGAPPPPTVEVPNPIGAVKNIAVVIANKAAPTGGDWRLHWVLSSALGHTVTFYSDEDPEVVASSGHHLVVVAPSCNGATIGAKYDARDVGSLPLLHLCPDAWITGRSALITNATTPATGNPGHRVAAVAGGNADFTWPGVTYDGVTLRQLHANALAGRHVPAASLLPGATRIAAPETALTAAAAFSLDVGDSDVTNRVMTARVVAIGTTAALLEDSVWSSYTDLVGAAVEWLAPTTSTQPPVGANPTALWVIGKSAVTPTGLFADPTEEASAAALARRGHTVTRVQSSKLTRAPLTSDCAVVVVLDGGVADWRWLRGTAVNAAPIWHANAYFWGDPYGYSSGSYHFGAGLSNSFPGSGRALANLQVRATTPVTWTDGYSVGTNVGMFGWNYVEWMTPGTSSSTVILADPLDTSRTVGFLAPVGATNIHGATLTARQAAVAVFPVGFHAMTEAGAQLADDILAWLGAATPAELVDPEDPEAVMPPVTGFVASSVMDNAIYTGLVHGIKRRRGSVTLSGPGLAAWLGEAENGQVDTIAQPGNGSFALWIDALLPPGIGRGLVTTAGSGTFTASYSNTTRRKVLDDVCDHFGAEWRMRPTGRLDAGTPDNIYGPGMAALALDGVAAAESDVRAMTDAVVELDWDASDYLTEVDAIADGVVGTAAVDVVDYRDLAGGILERRTTVAATAVTVQAEADKLAAAELARARIARHIKVTVGEHCPTRYAPCGSVIGVWAPDTDCEDLSNPVQAGGRTVFPVAARVRRVRWPIRRGCGVYLRTGFGPGAGRLIDITDHVQWETGPATYEVDSLRTPASVLRTPLTA